MGMVGFVVGAALVCTPTIARAEKERPVAMGTVIVGVERLMGVALETTTEDSGSMSRRTDHVSVALLGQGRLSPAPGPTLAPRIGADVAIGYDITLGASGLYQRTSGETESTAVSTLQSIEEGEPTIQWVVVNPRVGFLRELSSPFALWPRAGVTYQRITVKQSPERTRPVTEKTTFSLTQLSLEMLFVFTPFEGGAVLAGPVADIGLGGETVVSLGGNEASPEDFGYDGWGLVSGLSLVF
jgi:hypothetical protein